MNLFKQHKDKLVLAKLSGAQVLVSFATNLIILRTIGLGAELDVYYIALAVFFFLCSSLNWSIASVLVPYLVKNRGSHKEGALFISVGLLTLPIAGLIYVTSPLWLEVLYKNYIGDVSLTRIQSIQNIFIITYIIESLSLTFSAIVQERNKYIWFNASLLISSLFGLVFVMLTLDVLGIYAAVWNQLLMKCVLLFSLASITIKSVVKTITFDKVQLFEIYQKSKYILLGSLYFKTEELVEKYVASYLTTGFISLVAFVQRIYSAMVTVINSTVGIPSITTFSNHLTVDNYKTVKISLYRYLAVLTVFSAFVFIFMLFVGEGLFTWIMGDALIDDLKPMLLTSILCMCSFLLAKTVSQVNQSLLLALEKGSVATLYDSITFTVNILIKITATYVWGMYGFLLSAVASYALTETVKFMLVIKELNKRTNSHNKTLAP